MGGEHARGRHRRRPGGRAGRRLGPRPARAAALASRHGATAYEDVDALLDAVDAVAIALPPDVQAPLAARAARAGKHLVLDKPLALTVEAADEVVAAVEATGVSSVVFFTSRFTDTGAGFVAGAQGRAWDGGRATILTSLAAGPFADSPWRWREGGLWDVGPHALSLLLPVLGPVADVASAHGPHGTTTVLLTHGSGAVSTMVLSLGMPVDAVAWEVAFWGEPGWAVLPEAPDDGDAVGALVRAIGELRPDHPCGVQFGRDVVSVLASADRR